MNQPAADKDSNNNKSVEADNQPSGSDGEVTNKPSLLSMIKSVLAAIFGIQSDKNRRQDFQQGDASQFITLGIVATVVILAGMYLLVSSVIESAGR